MVVPPPEAGEGDRKRAIAYGLSEGPVGESLTADHRGEVPDRVGGGTVRRPIPPGSLHDWRHAGQSNAGVMAPTRPSAEIVAFMAGE